MSKSFWKLDKDLCRCCHGEGDFHSLSEPGHNLGQTELYLDMLNCSFGIEISQIGETTHTNAKTYTICDTCILRLRDASHFKQQVLRCETLYQEMYKNFIKAFNTEVKQVLPADYEEGKFVVVDIKEELIDMDDDSDGLDEKPDNDRNNPMLKKLLMSYASKSNSKSRKKPNPKGKKVQSETTAKIKVENIVEVNKKIKPKNSEIRPYRFYLRDGDYRVDGDDFYCTFCNKKYSNQSYLRHHVKINHYKVKCFYCKVCEKGFTTSQALIDHKLQEHNIDDRLKCKACDAVFSLRRQLCQHERTYHYLGKKYKCDLCEFETFSTTAFYKHKFKHKTVKKYNCQYCKKAFLRKGTLTMHERIHTGDKRKVCSVCSRAFVQKASLNYHMTKYHPEVNF